MDRKQREALRAAINALVSAAEWHLAEHTAYECGKDRRTNRRWCDEHLRYVQAAKEDKRKARRRLGALLRRIEGAGC